MSEAERTRLCAELRGMGWNKSGEAMSRTKRVKVKHRKRKRRRKSRA